MNTTPNKIKSAAAIVLALIFTLTAFPFTTSAEELTSGSCGDDATYSFDSATGTLTISGTGEVDTTIFQSNKDLTIVVVEDGITGLSQNIFSRCTALKTVTLPEGISAIRQASFRGCSALENIHLPSSVTQIDSNAFEVCENLTAMNLDNISQIGMWAFSQSGLREVTLSDSMTSLEDSVFNGCAELETINLSPNITSIGRFVFDGCTKLKSITIPAGCTELGDDELPNPFCHCSSLESITVASGNPVFDSRNNCNAIIRTADNTLVAGCKGTEIPDDVNTIGATAFLGSGITSITLPDSVTTVNSEAFSSCDNLTTINFNQATTLERYILNLCNNVNCYILNKDCNINGNSQTLGRNPTIYSYMDSTAQAYAEKFEYSYVTLCLDGTENHQCEKEIIEESTCLKPEGIARFTCTVCGYSYEDSYESDDLHDYQETRKEPTCTEDGVVTGVCSRCGDTYQTTLEKLGHQYEVTETVPPTTTVRGYTVYTCQRCGDSYQADFTDLLKDEYTGSRTTDYEDYRIVPGYGQIKVAWTNDEKIESYEIYLSTNGKDYELKATVATDSADYYILNNLTRGKQYYVKIKGYLTYNGERIDMEEESATQALTVK